MTEFHFHKVFKAHIQFATRNLVSNSTLLFLEYEKAKEKVISFLPHHEYAFCILWGLLKYVMKNCEYDAMLE